MTAGVGFIIIGVIMLVMALLGLETGWGDEDTPNFKDDPKGHVDGYNLQMKIAFVSIVGGVALDIFGV